jgi:hypothetical protein
MAPPSEMVAHIPLGLQGFGCMGLTAFYGPALKNEEGVVVLKAAYDAGCRHFDTAEIYQVRLDQKCGGPRALSPSPPCLCSFCVLSPPLSLNMISFSSCPAIW